MIDRLAPIIFVFLWSTGFIGAKYGTPYAEPMTLLAIRFLICVPVFLLVMAVFKSKLPRGLDAIKAMIAGLLIHALYLGGVFYSIRAGLPAGVSAVVVGLQPILVAMGAAYLLSERVSVRQWMGMVLGFVGVFLVLYGRMGGEISFDAFLQPSMIGVSFGLIAVSVGTIFQKRYCGHIDLVGGAFWQYVASFILCGLYAFAFETGEITWNWTLIGAIAWLVIALSLVAVLLLLYMVRRGEMAKVMSLMYLVPAVTALLAFVLFGEEFGMVGLIGMGATAFGVYLVMKKRAS